MKKDTRKKIISFSFLALAIFVLFFGVYNASKTESTYSKELPCYDKMGNKIVGVYCEGYQLNEDYFGLLISTSVIGAILLITSYMTHPARDRCNI